MSATFGSNQNEKRLLIVESDPEKRHLLSNFLSRHYECATADSVNSALDCASRSQFAVILVAIREPELTAHDLLPHLRTISPRSISVCLSEDSNLVNTTSAFKTGAFDVVQAPISLKAVETALKRAFGQYEAEYVKERYQLHLEELVAERTAELDKALETRDFETAGHSERVVTFSLRLGFEMGLAREAMRDLELGALLHDVGKIGVPDSILHKPTDLSEIEWAKMRLHPLYGQDVLRDIPFLRGAARIVAQHHEKWDGSGYPKGLRGEAIDVGARIFAVIDAFDAMVSERIF